MNVVKPQFAFFGTPELACDFLDELKTVGHPPKVIVTSPDKPKGRSLKVTAPAVKVWADRNDIPALQPEKLDADFLAAFKKHEVNFAIVVAYGKILPTALLESLPLGFFNVHYSLLPRHRGATPVEAAILSGDRETGVSIQKILYELDTGPIAATAAVAIGDDETAPELRRRLNLVAKKLLIEILTEIENGVIRLVPQDDKQATYCKKISKEDGLINLSDSGDANYRKYRAYFGWPGVYFFDRRGDKDVRVKIKKASLENARFKIETVVPEGKKEMAYEIWEQGKKVRTKT